MRITRGYNNERRVPVIWEKRNGSGFRPLERCSVGSGVAPELIEYRGAGSLQAETSNRITPLWERHADGRLRETARIGPLPTTSRGSQDDLKRSPVLTR